MHWPSGLKVTPDGTTRPTTGLETPANSSFFISCGTTDSDELVPRTVKISSLMYFRNFHKLKPDSHEMKPSTTTTKSAQVMYIVPISLPSETIEARPVLADGERHRAERCDRRKTHDHADDGKDAVDEGIEHGD